MDSREESRDGKSVRFAQIPARLVWLQIILMEPTNFAQPFSDPKWIFEPKWDSFRALCYFGESIKFISRRIYGDSAGDKLTANLDGLPS
jgi:ATP-dependent DNA ligase